MSAHPRLSVCIANYNGMAVLDACLDSVRTQVGGIPVEILVHDDASDDGSAAHLRANHPDVVLIESAENVGFCVANNRMAERAKGDYLLLLNNDAALLPDALHTLMEEARRLGRPAILGLPQYDAAGGELVDIGSLFDPFLNPVPNLDPNRDEVGMVIGACLWIPKKLWKELGGFPEWFGSIAEDMYLCCRARLAGYAVRALPISGYRHWQGQSFGGGRLRENRLSTTLRRRALSERNKSFVMALIYPFPLFQLLFPLHLALLVLEGSALSLLKLDTRLFGEIYFACLKALWRERHRLIRLRVEIQAGKKIGIRKFWSVFGLMPHKLRMLVRYGVPRVS